MAAAVVPPLVVGRYAVFDRIAAGGMAAVHVGRLAGEGGFARTVAVKRLHPQFALDPEFVAMFLDEARLAARIRHPNVVPTLDIVTSDGELFLVMEYVEGESLSGLLKTARRDGARVPVDVAAGVLAQALHGLHAAHEAHSDLGEPLGIVHRDVSPHNVLVGTDGVARVLDFGVAKALGKLHTTREGQLKGKLGYLAPEQILCQTVTRASDVFSASVVLWEALAGARLFAAESEGGVLHRILKGGVEPPGRHAPGLPPALDAVVVRGLSVEPADRFGTALAMAEAIEQAVPVASPRAIGQWVSSLATEGLRARADVIAAMESWAATAPVARGRELAPPTIPDVAVSSGQAVTVAVNADAGGAPRWSRARVAVGGAALGGVLVVGMAVAAGLSGKVGAAPGPATLAASGPASASASAPAPASASAPAPEAAPASASEAATSTSARPTPRAVRPRAATSAAPLYTRE